ncbi:MAG: cell division inhibitor SepF [Actinomycetota bacterium]|jgi:cell division inhibitor SepF|nr:cell division inhibitor SepF [Actinomycetota bacterium]
MSVFHKTMVWLGLVDDDEYYGEDDQYYADEYGEPISAPSRQPARVSAAATATAPPAAEPSPLTVIRSKRERDREDVVPPPAAAPRASAVKPIPMPATRVHVMDPKGFNDAQEVGDRLKNGQPVILNLQGVDRDLQRRLIDFASGLAYALNGTMAKAADQVFLLTPSNVEVSEEEKERLQARGLYRTARP